MTTTDMSYDDQHDDYDDIDDEYPDQDAQVGYVGDAETLLRRAIDKGVSKERLARAFNVNLSTINSRIILLHGICPKAVELLQDHQFTPDVTRHLRKMKAARQIEAVELMIAANSITAAHAAALLKATPPAHRTD